MAVGKAKRRWPTCCLDADAGAFSEKNTRLVGGWSGKRKDGAVESWKPDLKMVNATIKFVEANERLKNN